MYKPIVVKGLKNPDGTIISEYFGKPQIGFVAVREPHASNYPIHGLDDFKIPGMVKGVLEERETVITHLDNLLRKYGALLSVTYNPSTNVVTQKLQAGQTIYTRTFANNAWSNWSSDSLVLTSEMNTALAGKADSVHTHTKSQITDFAHTHDADDVYWLPQGEQHSYPISAMMVSLTYDVSQLQTGKSDVNHTHAIGDIDGWSQVFSDINEALDGKASLNHTHSISNVTGLQTALDGKADVINTVEELELDEETNKVMMGSHIKNGHSYLVDDVYGKRWEELFDCPEGEYVNPSMHGPEEQTYTMPGNTMVITVFIREHRSIKSYYVSLDAVYGVG